MCCHVQSFALYASPLDSKHGGAAMNVTSKSAAYRHAYVTEFHPNTGHHVSIDSSDSKETGESERRGEERRGE